MCDGHGHHSEKLTCPFRRPLQISHFSFASVFVFIPVQHDFGLFLITISVAGESLFGIQRLCYLVSSMYLVSLIIPKKLLLVRLFFIAV